MKWFTEAEEVTMNKANDDRVGYGEARVPGARKHKWTQSADQTAPAESGFRFFRESSKVPGGFRGNTGSKH